MKLSLLILGLAAASPLAAQTRVTLPAGTVLLVRTEQPLESAKAQVGQTFNTVIAEDVSVEGYTVIPSGTRIRGVVSYAQPATRRQSGVMQINFDRITFPAGGSVTIVGKLTSTDSTERRQIDARDDSRVVLVGSRGGAGAAIARAGNANSPTTSILGSLSSILSAGVDVAVPAGTTLAVQLERNLTMRVSGAADLNDESTIFTVTDRIRAAQRELARRAYYRGTPTGVLDNATRRAIYEFQLDNDIRATGNLDHRTARALGILESEDRSDVTGVLSARDAQALRRAAQTLFARQRQDLTNAAHVDLYFALSAFADNASLYEQFVQGNANRNTAIMAGSALLNAARRVDAAMQSARASQPVRNQWNSIRRQLQTLDRNYR